jgi:hypothetical protein
VCEDPINLRQEDAPPHRLALGRTRLAPSPKNSCKQPMIIENADLMTILRLLRRARNPTFIGHRLPMGSPLRLANERFVLSQTAKNA